VFTIRGKLVIYALEIVAAASLLLSMRPLDWHVQVGLATVAVLAVGFATLLGRSIASAIDRLVVSTRRIGEGNYDDPVLVHSSDEVGTLGREIDRMRLQLREKVRQLEELSRELEGKVARRTDALRQANERLSELSDLKSDFISKVSHELRTPLTSIMGAADNLLDGIAGPVDERPRSYLSRIKENADRLLHLINELLDLSRIEAGKEEICLSNFRLDALIGETLETLKPLAEERGVMLAAPQGPPLVIRADRDKVSRVLINLVDNGLKFTPPGGRVDIRARAEGPWVKVAVSDSGVGIPARELERIFDKFHQVERVRGGGRAGSGLGLSISRQLVEMHGGGLTVESSPGAGSTFTMTLPVADGDGVGPQAARESWHAS